MIGINDYVRETCLFENVPIGSTFIVGECVYIKTTEEFAQFTTAVGRVCVTCFLPTNVVELATVYKDRNFVQ